MAQLDLYLHLGDEQITGGDTGQKPATAYPSVLGGRSAGFALMMEEFGRVEPSDATGISGGGYDPYWDGSVLPYASTGTPTTTTIGNSSAVWSTNEFVGREVEITSGTQVGQKRRITACTTNSLTFSPALPVAPVAGDTFTIKGGWTKYFHAVTTSLSGIPYIADQRNARGDSWFGINSISPTTLLMNRLVKTYGHTGAGFRFLKNVFLGGVSQWMPATGGPDLDAQLTLAKEAEAAVGNTLRIKAIVFDSVTSDLFAVNLFYESDLQRSIDAMRNRMDVLGFSEAATVATATASTSTTLTSAAAGWAVNQWRGRTVRIDGGALAGELRLVASNTADTITLYNNTATGQNYAALPAAPGNVSFSILAAPLIILGNPNPGVAASIATVLAPGARTANQLTVSRNVGVRLFDWSFAGFAIPSELAAATAGDRYYDVPSYVQAGILLDNTIKAYFTPQPVAAPGAAIPCVFMNGTSQMVTSGMQSALLGYLLQDSILGDDPGTVTPGVYIWNDASESVEPLDVASNTATLGTFLVGTFGPEVTMGRALVRDRFPNGVVIFKYAKGGVALTSEAGASLPAGYVEPGGDWENIAIRFAKFKSAVMRDLNRSVDVIAIVNDLSDNDTFTQSALDAFKIKAPLHIDRQRELCQTRVNDDVIPVVWMQPPPAASVSVGGSALGVASLRTEIRDFIAEDLPDLRDNVSVVLNEGRRRYELQRADSIHYGGEAVLNLGEDYAAKILDLFQAEGGSSSETSPAGAAAFIVETGSGATDANSYATGEFADDYHRSYGDPVAWRSASRAVKENALREATRAADEMYGQRWNGDRKTGNQALDWPRTGILDAYGEEIGVDSVPAALQRWTARAALMVIGGTTFSPTAVDGSTIGSESLTSAGGFSKSITYVGGKATTQEFPALDRMLLGADLIGGGTGWGWLE